MNLALIAGTLAAALPFAALAAGDITAADYIAAEPLLEGNAGELIKNASIRPKWLPDGSGFWYQRSGDSGPEFVRVTLPEGDKRPAFDHVALNQALAAALGEGVGLSELQSPSPDATLKLLSATHEGKAVSCDLSASPSCTVQAMDLPPGGRLLSPDGRVAALTRDHNLYLLDLETGKERALTSDGEAYYAYGKFPDAGLLAVQIKKHGLTFPPFGAQFSPDGRYLLVPRVDERQVSVTPFVEWVPTDGSLRPIVHEVRTQLTGDSKDKSPIQELHVWDLQTGKHVELEVPAGYATGGFFSHISGWSLDRGQAYLIARTLGSRNQALLRAELSSGEVEILIEEASDTKLKANSVEYNVPNIRVLGDGAEVIWFSERSGWGHLYLYDAQTGDLRNAITGGDWLVQDIHLVDEAAREIYFTGGGREPARDPYYRHLYRASLDGGEPVLLTGINADHDFPAQKSPSFTVLFGLPDAPALINTEQDVFIDTWSTVSEPPVTVLRSLKDGALIAELETANVDALLAVGWKPPVRRAVKAADGKTDIYTVYWAPQKVLPDGKHPVIDAVYGGPQVSVAPRNFVDVVRSRVASNQAALARLGFAVVTTDGRGTPLRSKAFDDAGYPEFTQLGIDDHIAAIEQLASAHDEMDLERVGVFGHSWGGTFSAQAILSRPEFYDVAVSSAGVYDYAALYPGFEPFTGVPEYADGSIYRGSAAEKPMNWAPLDITALADRLEGKLMIAYGDMDENVPQNQAFRLVDALIKANKPYDLLYLPNRTHGLSGDKYFLQRRFDYFVEHLLGIEPPDVDPFDVGNGASF